MAQNISQFLLFVSIYILSMLLMICKLTYSANLLAQFCSNDTMFANNSQYQADLSTIFRYLTSNATNPTGYHSTISPSSDDTTNEAVYGHFLCLGDQNTSSCHDCVTTATTTDLPTKCPRRKDAIIWYDECLVRYSNHSFFGAMDEWPSMLYWNVNSILNNETRFMELMRSMMNDEIAVRAATGGSQKKFAVDYVNNTVFQTIYGLGQCTPDLSSSDCNTCLVNGVAGLRATQGGRVLQPSCVVRYEVYPFFDSSYLPPPPPPSQPPPPLQPPTPTDNFRRSNGNGSDKAKLAILITVPAVGLIAVAVGFSFFCCRKKRKGNSTETSLSIHQDENDESISLVSLLFRFDTIKVATDNFLDANKLGRGGFGTVYKGTLKNVQEVAVKRLSTDSGQGDGEFKTEVLLVAKLQHRNLVKLLGFCIERKERILIYEFVPNTSLDNFLFDTTKRSKLSWQNRYKIIAGIARGLLYLHEDSRLRIIHRDLKASNILLDANMNPKIADFGIARLFGVDQSQGDTNRIVGTYGYMAPEYALHGLFSIKSDVFSFGVLVLEIITGRKSRGSATQEQSEDLLSFVWRNWRDGSTSHMVDQTLASTRSGTEIMRCIQMGLLCVQENAEDRPTMSFVLLMLSSHSLKLPVPSHPAFVTQTASIGLHRKSDNTNRTLKITSANSMCEDSITDLSTHANYSASILGF